MRSNATGVLYPVYASLKVLESQEEPDGEGKRAKLRQWLTYWSVYGVLSVVESFTSDRLPLYYHLKLLLLLWLQSTRYKGAQRLYTEVLQPTLSKYMGKVDGIVARVHFLAVSCTPSLAGRAPRGARSFCVIRTC